MLQNIGWGYRRAGMLQNISGLVKYFLKKRQTPHLPDSKRKIQTQKRNAKAKRKSQAQKRNAKAKRKNQAQKPKQAQQAVLK